MARKPRTDEIFQAIETFTCNDESGVPFTVLRGNRIRGGEGSVVKRFPQWFLPDGALDDEIRAAREAAGLSLAY